MSGEHAIEALMDTAMKSLRELVDVNTIIGDIMDADENTAPYFMEMGMHCLFCPASRGETLEEACAVHGVPVEEMLEKLNKHFAE